MSNYIIRKTKCTLLPQHIHKQIMPCDNFDNVPGSVHWLVLAVDGSAVGFASARIITAENVVFLSAAGVLPCARGKGLQRKLIRARCNWARRQGCTHAITYTVADNYASYSNLQKCGFALYPPANAYRGRDVLYWRKVL